MERGVTVPFWCSFTRKYSANHWVKYLQCYPGNFTVRLLWPEPLRQSRPIGLQKNNNTFQESWLWANQQFVKQQQVTRRTKFKFWQKMFRKKAKHSGDIIVWHKLLFCHLPAISSLPLSRFGITSRSQVKNVTNLYVFCLRRHSNGPLRKHGLSSTGSKGQVYRL